MTSSSSSSFLLLFFTLLISCCVHCLFTSSSYHTFNLHNRNGYGKTHSSSSCIFGGISRSVADSSGDNNNKKVSYKLIKTQNEVNEAVEYLQSCSEVSLDLEFDRDRFAYGTTLSLIQAKGSSDEIYLLDALEDIDLDIFFRNVVENPSITKVIHAASEDIRIMHLAGYTCKTVFDTERTAKLLNFPFTSLAKVVENLVEIKLDKGEQTSNWIKRPLTKRQCLYAAQDVMHLQTVKSKMIKIAEEMGTLEFVEEENLAWDHYKAEVRDGNNFVSKKDMVKFSSYELYVYNELLKHRDHYARKVDKPPHFVIPKDILIDIAMIRNEDQTLTFFDKQGIHPVLRKRGVEREFTKILNDARISAQEMNLCKIIPKRPDNTEDKLSVLNSMYPLLHQHLVQKYGLNTANHILPNKLATELATERKSINDIEYVYKRKIFADFKEGMKSDGVTNAKQQDIMDQVGAPWKSQ